MKLLPAIPSWVKRRIPALDWLAHDKRKHLPAHGTDRRLVRRDQRLIWLFDPPFANAAIEPDCIKGYPPGVREDGGLYSRPRIMLSST